MAAQEPARAPAGEAKSPVEGFSQFVAKVLDQLSVSAWLPALMLVSNLAVLVQLSRLPGRNVGDAIARLTESPLSIVVVLFFGVILGTIVAQAFAFETIRLLEGYWGRGRLFAWVVMLRTARHEKRLRRLDARRHRYQTRAFRTARAAMLTAGVSRAVIDIHEDRVHRRATDPRWSATEIAQANAESWLPYAAAGWLRRLDAVGTQCEEFPEPSRILPTRLGNVLRSREDRLVNIGDELEGMVLRCYDRLPARLQLQHDQFRNRLDMYCTLVLVAGLLAVTAPALLIRQPAHLLPTAVITVGYLLFGWISYLAAIASARGYGTILLLIDERLAPEGNT